MFDLDGTLVDSAADLAAAVNNMLCDLGHREEPLERVMTWVGNGMSRLVKRALTGEMQAEPDAALFERGLASFKRHYAENLGVRTRPYPGTIEALDTLSKRGFTLVCMTNKPEMFTQPLLEQLHLSRYFELVVSGDTTPARKPDPMPLRHACERLGVEVAHAIMIGDSANDILAAQAAGMPAICVTYGYNQGQDLRDLAPDLLVDSLAEVPQYLRLL